MHEWYKNKGVRIANANQTRHLKCSSRVGYGREDETGRTHVGGTHLGAHESA